MRMFFSLLAAWLVASAAFALAWLRPADPERSLYIMRHVFFDFGFMIGVLVLVVGLPAAYVLSRRRLVRWWSWTGIAAAFGGVLGYLVSQAGPIEGSGTSFSPWNRSRPGIIGEFETPWSIADQWGSLAFGAIIGGLMGVTFWLFYMRLSKHHE